MGDVSNPKQIYTIRKSKNSNEYHVFYATSKDDNSCISDLTSICNKLKRDDSTAHMACITKDEVRHHAAPIGDNVCGLCMSKMYKTIE